MKNIRIKSTITTHWTVLDSNGQVVNLSQYDVKVYYITGLGRSEGKNVTVSGSGVVTWVFKPADQTFQGVYHLLLSCSKDGEVKASYELRDVFRLSDAMYDYYGNITLNLVSGGAEGGDTPGGGGLIQVVYTEQDFGGEFDENCRNDTFNAHATNRLHERLSDAEHLLDILQLDRYTILVFCENGANMLRQGAEADLRAEVWRDQEEDITDRITGNFFSWKRSSGNALLDEQWNNVHEGVGPRIHVTREDVNKACTFYVEVPIEVLKQL